VPDLNASNTVGDSFNQRLSIPPNVGTDVFTGIIFTAFPPSFYKVNNIQSYNIAFGCQPLYNLSQGFGTSVPDFQVDITCRFWRQVSLQKLTPYGSSLDPMMMFPFGKITYSDSLGFNWLNNIDPSFNFDLRDTIQTRRLLYSGGFVSGYDFSNVDNQSFNNKIRQDQYNDLLTSTNTLLVDLAYELGSLTTAQLDKFNGVFNPTMYQGGFAFTISLKMIGLLASYEPINP
jgi:hypothetical protein